MEPFEITKTMFGKEVIKYPCPNCHERLRSPLTDAGKTDSCANCRCQFIVPGKADLQSRLMRQAEEVKQKHAAQAAAEQAEKLEKAKKLAAIKEKEKARHAKLEQKLALKQDKLARKTAAGSSSLPYFEKDPVMVLVLGFVTCGLYLIYWNIKAAEVLNAVSKTDRISPPIAVLSGFCFPVNVYFYYLCGQAMPELGRRIGKEQELKDKSTLLLILGLFLPMVSAMIVQGHINELYDTNQGNFEQQQALGNERLPSKTAANGSSLPYFKKDPVMVLVLGFVTCGLYLIYWNIKAAEVLNAVSKTDRISPPIAVLSGFCFPVNVYFYYLCGQAMPELGRRIGKEQELKDKSTLLLILGLFLPMVSAMIVQGHINEFYDIKQ